MLLIQAFYRRGPIFSMLYPMTYNHSHKLLFYLLVELRRYWLRLVCTMIRNFIHLWHGFDSFLNTANAINVFLFSDNIVIDYSFVKDKRKTNLPFWKLSSSILYRNKTNYQWVAPNAKVMKVSKESDKTSVDIRDEMLRGVGLLADPSMRATLRRHRPGTRASNTATTRPEPQSITLLVPRTLTSLINYQRLKIT